MFGAGRDGGSLCLRNSVQAWQPRVLIQEAESGTAESQGIWLERRFGPGWEGLRVPSEGDWILFGKLTKVLRKLRHDWRD